MTETIWTLKGLAPRHKLSKIATVFSANDHDQLPKQLKMCKSSEDPAFNYSVSSISRGKKKTKTQRSCRREQPGFQSEYMKLIVGG